MAADEAELEAGTCLFVSCTNVRHNYGVQVRFTQSTRKHRIGRAHALHVMDTVTPTVTPATATASERRTWIGPDDRALELEIIAIVEPNYLLVIHVMPTSLRG